MDLEEILSLLDGEELDRSKVKESFKNFVNDVEEKGKSSYRKKDKEVLKFKEALKGLGWNADEQTDLEGFIDSLKTTKTKVSDADLTIQSLNSKLNEITTSLEKERTLREQKEKEAKQGKISSKLATDLAGKVKGVDKVVELLTLKGVFDTTEEGNLYYKKGDEKLSYDDGLKHLLDSEFSEWRIAEQNAGTGTGVTEPQPEKDNGFEKLRARMLAD